jgi:hypothetical protein
MLSMLTVLLGAQQFARAADLQVAHGNAKARALTPRCSR